jgi:hypothetical protein
MASIVRSDHYLAHPEALKGQPKRTIADYAEANGILVPRRFDSLKEAYTSGLEVLARSEHPQDYAGSSDLLDSLRLKQLAEITGLPLAQSQDELRAQFTAKTKISGFKGFSYLLDHSKLLGLDYPEFKAQVSYSLWEWKEGFSRTVVADSAVEGRYHVLTRKSSGFEPKSANYTLFDNGKVIDMGLFPLSESMRNGIPVLVETYEAVRNLQMFDPNHCPIMEFVTFGDKDYFVQYHRGRNFVPPTFSLDRRPESDETTAMFVRGVTPPEGVTYGLRLNRGFDESKALPVNQDGSALNVEYTVVSEIMVRRMKLQLLYASYTLESKLTELSLGHGSISTLFKPEVSIIHSAQGAVQTAIKEVKSQSTDLPRSERANQTIAIHAVSDGKIAYLKRA